MLFRFLPVGGRDIGASNDSRLTKKLLLTLATKSANRGIVTMTIEESRNYKSLHLKVDDYICNQFHFFVVLASLKTHFVHTRPSLTRLGITFTPLVPPPKPRPAKSATTTCAQNTKLMAPMVPKLTTEKFVAKGTVSTAETNRSQTESLLLHIITGGAGQPRTQCNFSHPTMSSLPAPPCVPLTKPDKTGDKKRKLQTSAPLGHKVTFGIPHFKVRRHGCQHEVPRHGLREPDGTVGQQCADKTNRSNDISFAVPPTLDSD